MQNKLPSGGEDAPSLSRPEPAPDDIRTQLDRIIASPEFPRVGRSAAFLTYVTEEALAGRAERIKGYTIAVEVFKRSEGFKQDDPVVRIEAGRLRRVLERYYLIAGQHDPVRIDIPKGGYAPSFVWNEKADDAVA
ncbi:adenylate cyclase, partial [Pseudomonas sp. BGM005]|nr:adenylate cyclase [Pseudomonas sp. BG5]